MALEIYMIRIIKSLDFSHELGRNQEICRFTYSCRPEHEITFQSYNQKSKQKSIGKNRKAYNILMGQLSALFYKNWVLYKRSVLANILQVLIPIFFMLFFVLVRKVDEPITYGTQSFYTNPVYSYAIDTTSPATAYLKNCTAGSIVGLAPAGDSLVASLSASITALGYTVQTFPSEKDFQTYIRDENYPNTPKVCFGVIVDSSTGTYQYKLRFNISSEPSTTDGPTTKSKITQDQAIDLKIFNRSMTGMVGAATLVNNAIFKAQTGGSKSLKHSIAPIYQQEYVLDNIYKSLSGPMEMLVLIPLLLLYVRQTSNMLTEKQTKIRESMSIMGMKLSNYYISWFVRFFSVYLVLHLICSGIIVSQFPHIPFYVPFLVFILFDIVLIIQNFFIQVFLSRAKIGILISYLFFAIQYIFSLISTTSDNPTIRVNAGLSVIPHAAYIMAFRTMLYAESNKITASFGVELNNYVIGYALASFFFNIVLYLILTWYLDQVVPNEWGAKKNPLFCCFDKQITSFTEEQKEQKKKQEMSQEGYASTHEPIDQNLRSLQKDNKFIDIVGLRKEFNGGQSVAVDNLTISMYNSQIFALLGHNGAGKTTTISMLTGMIEPTDGYISVLGETELYKIRSMIGVCPQHDTLYEDLTVEEHLMLFSSFKGLEDAQLTKEVDKLINDVNLGQKRHEYTKNLSGGQKRRLSVAIAFAGRSKVIILDKPTSGMDTSARRYIWELLKTYKNDRIIILTTHFMDEADYLGDRIGIMGEGKMTCCGSSIYLKNRFGVGYNLTFVKESSTADGTPIYNTVKKHIPNAKILSNVAGDLSIQLPIQNLGEFSKMFNEIDSKKSQLKYLQYGISITTLEEVFLRVGEQLQKKHLSPAKTQNLNRQESILIQVRSGKGQKQQQIISQIQNPFITPESADSHDQLQVNFDEIPRQYGTCTQFWIHFTATFSKRLRVIRRDLKSFIFELILPILIMVIAMFIMRISFISDFPAQTINVNTYLGEQRPVLVPIGSTDVTYTPTLAVYLSGNYGSDISVSSDTTNNLPAIFDQSYLLPLKKQQATLKGGIFFKKPAVADTTLEFTTLVNTRSPTSFFFLQTLATEAMIEEVSGNPVKINVVNYPLPRTYRQLQINNTISGFLGSFIFSLALSFKFASIISFIVKQRQDRSKHQQLVSGMRISAYWTSNFIYDFLLYLIVAIVAVGICKGLQIASLSSGNAFAGTCLLFLFYGLAYISFTYIFGFLFKDYGNAQAGFFFITFTLGGMLPILTLLLRFLGAGSNPLGRGLAWLFRLYPAFAFGEGLLNMGSGSLYGTYENDGKPLDPLALEMALAPIIYLAVGAFLYFGLLFLIEALKKNENFMRCFTSEGNVDDSKGIMQSDVLEERKNALKAEPQDYQILTKQLRKVYMIDSDKKYKVAVDNLSFAIQRGEVFGLLGVNGAGKSTTFKMLAGEITSTSGESYFNGLKISQNLDKVRQSLGYCPQFDALIENLTVREQLELFYDMKSLARQQKDAAITRKIGEMNLTEYEDKLSGTLSGGNKRKLSVAMAMIGNPRIIFLDEPSTGMDPKARRFMWKVISRVATEKKNATVILTTHSMQQAEALSSRLGIMVKGNFQCIGTPQHIKAKYGEGFQIQIKSKPFPRQHISNITRRLGIEGLVITKQELNKYLDMLQVEPEDRLEISETGAGNFIYNELEGRKKLESSTLAEFAQVCKVQRRIIASLANQAGAVQVLERIQTFIRLNIKKNTRVSQLFDFFEKKKEELNIQQYTVKQASVEQIFNRFADKNEASEYGP